MRYGLPYKGSKNQIAKWLIDQLPPAETFVDLFFGGGAVTHAALLSGKYKRFIINDIDARLPKLFLECIRGEHTIENHTEFVSREEFERKKDADIYTALVWSFGNNKTGYIYGKDVEDFKKQLHRAVFEGFADGLATYGFNIKISGNSPTERYRCIREQIKAQRPQRFQIEHEALERLQAFERLEALERLQALERLEAFERLEALERLEAFGMDYRDIKIPPNSLIYCDIPYSDTDCGGYGGGAFDHNAFYEWALQQDNIFISEYKMPMNFIEIANIEKTVLCGVQNTNTATERLYTNRRTYDCMSQRQKDVIASNLATQISLFDYAFNPYQD